MQLEHERSRREKMEAKLDQYKLDNTYLMSQLQQSSESVSSTRPRRCSVVVDTISTTLKAKAILQLLSVVCPMLHLSTKVGPCVLNVYLRNNPEYA